MRSPSSRANRHLRDAVDFSGNRIRVTVENVVFASSDKGDGFCFALHSGSDDRRCDCIFGEEIVPGFEHDGMHEHDFAGNVAGFFEVGGAAVAHVDHRDVLDGRQCWSPGDGYTAYAEVNCGNLRELGIEGSASSADGHLGRAFCPGMRDGEIFGMDAIGSGDFERVYAPIDGTLHGGCAGNATADFVRQFAQVVLYRGWLKRELNDASVVVGVTWLERRLGRAAKD